MDEGVCLVLEARQTEEKEQEDQNHAQPKAEEEARLIEKERIKPEEEYYG